MPLWPGGRTLPAVDLDALADLKLSGPDAAMHRLGDSWRDRPVVLVFLRHFG